MVGADWANLTVAGAFVVGALVGAVATLRLVKVLAAYLSDLAHRKPPHPDP